MVFYTAKVREGLRDEFRYVEGLIRTLREDRQAQDDLVKRLLDQQTELVRSFQKLQDQYTEGLQRARQTIQALEQHQADQAPKYSSTPLYFSEDEEDLEAQLMSGQIEPGAYKEAMRALSEAGAIPKIELD